MRKRQRIIGWLVNCGIFVILTVMTVANYASVASAQRAAETNDETAMAVPRLVLPGSDRIDFPRPLSPGDVALIKHILNLQANGAHSDADRELTYLSADWMVGPILASRYLSPNYHPTADELEDWLRRFGDQSDSGAIAARLRNRNPAAFASETEIAAEAGQTKPHQSAKNARRTGVRALFLHNRDAEAVSEGRRLLKQAAQANAPDDLFAAGLAAWRRNDHATAVSFFIAAYETVNTEAGRAAAAYWTAHAYDLDGRPGDSTLWLRRAALEQNTFYGRIARRKLGLTHVSDVDFDSERTMGAVDFDRLLAIPRARRAFGLLQIGDKRRAEDELRALSLDVETEPSLEILLGVVADAIEMPSLGGESKRGYGVKVTAADRESPPILRPAGGFIVDPTIVYGIVQHESNFHPDVVSSIGARGLMQIMPVTAKGIGALPSGQARRLAEPAVNLFVGQRYLLVLADDPDIKGDLLRLLSAYGQGQAAMKRWVSSVNDGGDPLMFIEAVPSPVLRGFLFDALAASWHFAVALRLPSPSLDALAEGRYPQLTRQAAQPIVLRASR